MVEATAGNIDVRRQRCNRHRQFPHVDLRPRHLPSMTIVDPDPDTVLTEMRLERVSHRAWPRVIWITCGSDLLHAARKGNITRSCLLSNLWFFNEFIHLPSGRTGTKTGQAHQKGVNRPTAEPRTGSPHSSWASGMERRGRSPEWGKVRGLTTQNRLKRNAC